MNLLIIIILILLLGVFIYSVLKPKKILTKPVTTNPKYPIIKYERKTLNLFNIQRNNVGLITGNQDTPKNHELVTKHKLKKGTTPYYRLQHTAFYANWAQFWPGGPDDKGTNSPNTFKSFIANTDKIIYGFLLFGVSPNPILVCDVTLGSVPLSYSCGFNPNIIDSGFKDTFIDAIKDTLKADEEGLLTDFLKATYNQISIQFNKNTDSYIPAQSFGTFPPYPNECFTGANYKSSMGGMVIKYIGDTQGTKCPMNGRLHDFFCFQQLQNLKQLNGNLKVIASYGGWTWTHGGAEFSNLSKNLFTTMVSNKDNRTNFIDSSYKFLTKFGFNGVDFDWEYPGQNSALDFYGLECLIKEYKAEHPDMFISMQCSGFLSGNVVTLNMDTLPGYTDVVLTMKNDTDYFIWLKRLLAVGLDNINVMTYDYYTAYSEPKLTRPNAPLYNKEYPSGITSTSTSTSTSSTSTTTSSTQPINKCKVISYTVVSGDTLSNIAGVYNTTADNICAANNLPAATCPILSVGQVLNIPTSYWVPECDPTSACTSNSYTIKSGDTMYNIATTYGTDLTTLCGINNLTLANCGNINVGQVIKLPDSCSLTYPTINLTPASTAPVDDINYCLSKTLALMESIFAADMKKVILGLACYGRAVAGVNFGNLTGQDLIDKTVGIPFTGPAGAGSYTNEGGVLSYYEINNRTWTMKGYNKEYGTSIAVDVKNGIWVSYDDTDSLQEKMTVAKKYNVGGVMTFTPQQDDFSRNYPLMQTVTNHL